MDLKTFETKHIVQCPGSDGAADQQRRQRDGQFQLDLKVTFRNLSATVNNNTAELHNQLQKVAELCNRAQSTVDKMEELCTRMEAASVRPDQHWHNDSNMLLTGYNEQHTDQQGNLGQFEYSMTPFSDSLNV